MNINAALQDVLGNVFTIGDKVIYNSTGQYAHLLLAEVVDVYEATNTRWPMTKIQIRKLKHDDPDYRGKIITLEYKSNRFYRIDTL